MGTHPIFESDFDCLTDMGDFNILKYTGSEYSGDVENGRMEGKGEYVFASAMKVHFSAMQIMKNMNGLLKTAEKLGMNLLDTKNNYCIQHLIFYLLLKIYIFI